MLGESASIGPSSPAGVTWSGLLGEYVDHYNGQPAHRGLQLHHRMAGFWRFAARVILDVAQGWGDCFASTRALRVCLLHE